jgi:hypothetical protein
MLRNMATKDTAQFHIRPPRDVINRLDDLARKYKRDSPNQVAVPLNDFRKNQGGYDW